MSEKNIENICYCSYGEYPNCGFRGTMDECPQNRILKCIPFLSRHEPTQAQKEAIKLFFCAIDENENFVFKSDDPVNELKKAGYETKTLAIVCPNHIFVKLLNAGYTIYEFENEPSKRNRGVFVCKGVYKYFCTNNQIGIEYKECPIPIDEQEETSLNYTLKPKIPEGYALINKTSEYYGSHSEYGEGDQEYEFLVREEDKKEAIEFKFSHGHFSDNHKEFIERFHPLEDNGKGEWEKTIN